MSLWQWGFVVCAGVGLAELAWFVWRYATGSPWRSTPAGKALMAVMIVLGVMFALIFTARLMGGLGAVVWTVALGTLDVVIFQWLRLLHREQRNGGNHDNESH